MTKKFYMVRYDGSDEETLTLSKEHEANWRVANDSDITLERIVDLLDLDAEGNNIHDFVTTHRALAALLMQLVGRKEATKIFVALVDFGGLHGLTGVGGVTDVKLHENKLGVRLRCWVNNLSFSHLET
jgi:hypothetical protein